MSSPYDWLNPDVDAAIRQSMGIGPMAVVNNESDPTLQYLQSIARNSAIGNITTILPRGLIGRVIPILTTPTLLFDGKVSKGFIILNPTTDSSTGTAQTHIFRTVAIATTDGNTDANFVSAGNYRTLVMFANVTGATGAGTLKFFLRSRDPSDSAFVSAPFSYDSTSSVSAYRSQVGIQDYNVGIDMSVGYTLGGFTDATFGLSCVLKGGLPGLSNGLSRSVFLGDANVTTTSGFPLLEGQSHYFVPNENVGLYAVAANTGVTLSVFDL